jgi:hypothetical protein
MIRHLGPQDRHIFRHLRLEALRAEPAAYASSAEDWENMSDEEWCRRLTANVVLADFYEGEAVAMMGLMRQTASNTKSR